MLTIAIALAAALAVSGGLKLVFVHSSFGLILPFLATFITVIAVALRRVGGKLEPVMKEVERHLAGARRELALKSLRDAMSLKRWHPMIEGQLRAQIGALHYDAGKLDEAEEELARASRWPWTSRALL